MTARSVYSPIAVLAVAGALLAAGCGDDDEATTGGASSAPAETTTGDETTGGGGGGGDAVAVSMENTQYVPQDVEVPVDGTITWTNNDPFPHTVTKETGPGADFDSGDLGGGDTFEQTFDEAGEIDYVCEIHPNQTGTISVTE